MISISLQQPACGVGSLVKSAEYNNDISLLGGRRTDRPGNELQRNDLRRGPTNWVRAQCTQREGWTAAKEQIFKRGDFVGQTPVTC